MGGTSSSQQSQASTTNPWAPAQPALQGILGQVQGNLGNTGLTGAESGALSNIENNYAPQIGSYTQSMLNGGGAMNQAGAVNQNYQDYQNAMNPMASNTDYNPYNTPGFKDAIGTMTSDITNQVNGQFAGAGRDFSGANQMALGRGIAQGVAPTIANQYNANVSNQQGAANNRFAGGNTSNALLSGLQQQYVANQGQGASQAGNDPVLAAEAARRGIPVQALGLLASIGVPIAGLGGQSTGNSNGSQNMSGAQQFGMISGGIGNLFKGLGSL